MTERPEKLGQLALNKKGAMFYSGKCNCPASLQVLRSYNSETNDGNQEIIIIWLLCKQNITGLKNPNWREDREQIQQVPRAGLEPGTRRIASPMQ